MRRAALVVLLGVVALASLAACGLPEDRRPILVGADDAPLDLDAVGEEADATPDEGEEVVNVYFLNSDQTQLRLARRAVDTVDVASAVEALLLGPTEPEGDELTDAIPAGVVLLDSTVEAGLATVNLGPAGETGILSVQSDAQARAFAQLVYTVTSVAEVDRVRFLVEGQPVDAPNDGAAVAEVTRASYASLRPPSG